MSPPPPTTPLASIYARHAGDAEAATPSEDDLAAACERAGAAWPGFDVPSEALVAALARRSIERIDDAGLAELGLAVACAAGDTAAHRTFDERFLDVVPAALAHMKLSPALVDDVRQAVREKLLLADGDRPPRIASYAGDGKLRSLVHVVAVRTAISALRKDKRLLPVDGDELHELPDPDHDPELAFMKRTYRAEFKDAFQRVLAELTDRERNLLRMHLLGGVTLEALAEMYGVHRATVVRWLASARRRVFTDTRRQLSERLHIDSGELDSLMHMIQSRLDVSISRVLRSSPSDRSPSD
jgi:RNA polymerase sigma-70 factor (ECF subfamily)